MMSFSAIPIWKEAPFLRLVVPLTGGIIFQWYLSPSIQSDWLIFIAFSCFVFLFSISRQYVRFVYGWVYGVLLQGSLFFFGALLINGFRIRKTALKTHTKRMISSWPGWLKIPWKSPIPGKSKLLYNMI